MGAFDDIIAAPAEQQAPQPGPFDDIVNGPSARAHDVVSPFSDIVNAPPTPTLAPVPQSPATSDPNAGPDFWTGVRQATGKGLVEGFNEMKSFGQATASKLSGGEFFNGAAPVEESPTEVDNLLKTPVSQGWSNSKWWGANLAYGTAKGWPMLMGGMLGEGLGGGAGAAVGGGVVSAAQSIIPAFQDAKKRGLSDEDAINEASLVAAINGGTGALMGLAPSVSVLGRTAVQQADGQVGRVLARPIAETLIQLGLVQPGIGTGGAALVSEAKGQHMTFDEGLTSWLINTGQGALLHGGITATKALRDQTRSIGVLASSEDINAAHNAQVPEFDPFAPRSGPEPEGGVILSDTQPVGPIFYSEVKNVIEQKIPKVTTPEQIMGTLRNHPGVREEEVAWLGIPDYLANAEGKISKDDLLAHIEQNQVRLVEKEHFDLPDDANERMRQGLLNGTLQPLMEAQTRQGKDTHYFDWTLPGKQEKYGEILMYWDRGEAPPVYKAPHFRNLVKGMEDRSSDLLAHIRYTDRFDRDGKKTLFLEEIQSDWHQAGRKAGYARPVDPTLEKSVIPIEKKLFDHFLQNVVMDEPTLGEAMLARVITPEEAAMARDYMSQLSKEIHGIPEAPFKSSWQELMFKRALRYAADNGYERIAWANGEQQVARYPQGTPEAHQGLRNLYDRELPKLAEKWGKKLGMDRGDTRVNWKLGSEPNSQAITDEQFAKIDRSADLSPQARAAIAVYSKVRYMDVSEASASRIQRGFPLFDLERPHVTLNDNGATRPDLVPAVKQGFTTMHNLAKKMGINSVIRLETSAPSNVRGDVTWYPDGSYRVRINTRIMESPERAFATIAHEFGHIIELELYKKADAKTHFAILNDYNEFRKAVPDSSDMGQLLGRRDSAVKNYTRYLEGDVDTTPLSRLSPRELEYWRGFKEWFAESTAKWITTHDKPLSVIDHFFASLGLKLREVFQTFSKISKYDLMAPKELARWLDSFIKDTPHDFAQAKHMATIQQTQKVNQAAIDNQGAQGVVAAPQTPTTQGGRSWLKALGLSGGPGGEMAAHGDRMNKFYEWMINLPQLAQLNPHIRGLQLYKELTALMHLEKNQMMAEADVTLRRWKKLPRDQQDALGLFFDDYMNARFRTPQEVAKGIVRKPTPAEMQTMASKYKMSKDSLDVAKQVFSDFKKMLGRYEEVLRREAGRITDPVEQAAQLQAISKQIALMDSKPYMPAFRFGDFTVTIYDDKGNVRHFETFETLRQQRAAAREMEKTKLPGEEVKPGFLKKDVRPMLGMPPGLLDLIADKLSLNQNQKDALNQLKYEYSPAQSFRHRFQKKELVSGYSFDWQRAYANYFFHGSNHFTRVKYVDSLRDQIQNVWESRADVPDETKRTQIRNFMSEHLNQLIDPKADFAFLRGMMFHWYLGFNPASAALNLTQTPLMTFPFLANKFGGLGLGDLRAMKAMARAATDLSTFYKKGTYANATSGHMWAIGEAIKEGVITETQAHELAALSEGRTLLKSFGRPGERLWQTFSEYSSKMFEGTEQWNRRVAFRSAWDLATQHVTSKFVLDAVRDNPLQYQRLIQAGRTHEEAAAFTAAKLATEQTQFVYAPYARPKIMWGKKGALFIFKNFTQNTLFNLWNYPGAAARTMVILAALGGLKGLPFAEDIDGLIKGLAARLFGKDFSLEDELRTYVKDVTEGKISADLLLHGVSRNSFGIPQVLDMMGSLGGAGHVPFPSVDMSKSIGMGNVLPIDPGKLLTPAKDVAGNETRLAQRASGAGFGLGFALYNFLNSNAFEEPDRKKWEQIVPRAVANVSAAVRFASEGMERNKQGNPIVRFDPHDTEQLAEIVGKSLGFQPRRLTAAWDNTIAKAETTAFWDIRREVIMRQFYAAWKEKDAEGVEKVKGAIRTFNAQLPEEARGKAITSQAITQSVTNKATNAVKQERGIPTNISNLGIYRRIDELYPEGAPAGLTNVRKVQ